MSWEELYFHVKLDIQYHGANSFLKAFYLLLFDAKLGLLLNYRLGRFFDLRKNKLIVSYLLNKQITKRNCQISYKSIIKDNVSFLHPIGIVIWDKVIINSNVKIWQQVTLGSYGKENQGLSYPEIKEGVKIFAGVKIISSVIIGVNSIIGDNAFVLSDVPSN